VAPQNGGTGSMTLTLYNVPPDVSTPITPGGASVTATTTTPGQNAQITFVGTAGQRVSLQLSNVTMNIAVVTLLKPDGTALGGATYAGSGGAFVDTRVLPTTGTYTLLVDPYGTATGSITLTLYNVPPDFSSPITPGGPSVTVTTTTPGQNAQITFAGSAGQRVSLQLSNVTMNLATVTMLAPDGTTFGGTTYAGSGGAFVDTRVLPSTGTYTLVIDPQFAYVGSITLTLYNVPPDVTASVTPGGAPVTVTTTTPGQNAQLTFAGTAGQAVSLQFSGVTIPSTSVSVTGPDGKYVLSPSIIFTIGATFNFALPLSGTFTIAVDPQFAYVGSVTAKLT
jgi:hypothetical protein